MNRLLNHIMGRFYEARAGRALRRYHRLKSLSEKFFRRVPRADREGAEVEE
ncbi:MAG: hypothetical protein L0G27_02895 [Paracoccus sp. (in: a-proteobacteria)]|nr:hypothetical protein [Paracoccus sp. (in: a-proteobacteria)]